MNRNKKRNFVAVATILGASLATLASSRAAHAQNIGSELTANQSLLPGQWMTSPDGSTTLNMSSEMTLVYQTRGSSELVWTSNSLGRSSIQALMQGDSNFVFSARTSSGSTVVPFASNTNGWIAGTMTVNNGGTFSVNGVLPYWATGAAQVEPPPQPTPPPSAQGSRLTAGQRLGIGQYLQSPSGEFVFALQGDGNLVLYQLVNQTWHALWASGTVGKAAVWAEIMDHGEVQAGEAYFEGDLVLVDAFGTIVWAEGATYRPTQEQHPSWERTGAYLNMQDDGNVVLYMGLSDVYGLGH